MRTTFKIIGLVSAIAIGAVAVQSAIAGPGGYGMGRGGNGPMMMSDCPYNKMGGGQMGQRGQSGRMGGFGPAVKMSVTFDEAWAEKTKTEIGITGTQTPAWDTYITAIKDGVEMMKSFRDNRDPATMRNLPSEERLALRNSHWETRLELAKDVEAAKVTLVSQLTEEQKVKAIALLPNSQPTRFSTRRFNRN
ncbi:MAG: Spy/CpxP family protein refolding chaperone [Rhodospirillales bacterium]|nr:Spy/CpxP family protein refolding chaperone [Rhodospirillales bacterium]